MLYTIPDYYKQFRCTAADCEDTCCAGWQIVIDEKSLGKYKKVRGHFGKRLRASIDWKEKAFYQSEDKRCAFLNEENLCDLYMALGKKSLCKTCKRYPRHVEEFENVREISLSVSCPEVAKILLSRETPVRFLDYEKEGEEEFRDFDVFLYSVLADTRAAMLRIIQNRQLKVGVRGILILGLAHDVETRMKKGELFACQEVLERYEGKAAEEFAEKKLSEYKKRKYKFSLKMFSRLHYLEKLRPDWELYMIENQSLLFAQGEEKYAEYHQEFEQWCAKSDLEWEIKAEQLLVYFIFTYFCGAIYDGKVLAKVQMSVTSVFLIYEMFLARWLKNERELHMEDMIETVYRYSREVEHSDQNLELAERLMRFQL